MRHVCQKANILLGKAHFALFKNHLGYGPGRFLTIFYFC